MLRSFILMLAILALASAEDTTAPVPGEPQLVAQYQILGETDIDPGTKLWDTYDLGLSDVPGFDVASTLNDASLGAGASSTPHPTTSPAPDDEGWPWWYYLFIGLGGALVLAAIGGLIWYSVNKKKQPAAKDYAPIHPEPEPTAGRRRTAGGFPAPHPSSKVIQIPLVHHQVYPLFAETPV